MKCIGSGAVTLFAVLRLFPYLTFCQGDWNHVLYKGGEQSFVGNKFGKEVMTLSFSSHRLALRDVENL